MGFWMDRQVLVTGASGLLGSWLVEALLEQGANVTCLVRDWVPRCRLVESGVIERINVVRGELQDYETLIRVLNEYEIDSVFHLGAQTIVGTATRSPLSTFESNIRGTWQLLEACRTCTKRIQRVVVASSDKAYGVNERLPYTEDEPLHGRSPYDVSKSCADLIATSYAHTYRTPIAVTRCGNLYGGGDLNFNRLIPGTIRSALRGQMPIVRSDGTFVRDYFYVRDAVKAYLALAERLPDEHFIGHAFNFSNETPLSVVDIVNLILRMAGKASLEPRILNEVSDEIPCQYLDCSKAKRMLDWKPIHSLTDGLAETIQWYRDWLEVQA